MVEDEHVDGVHVQSWVNVVVLKTSDILVTVAQVLLVGHEVGQLAL